MPHTNYNRASNKQDNNHVDDSKVNIDLPEGNRPHAWRLFKPINKDPDTLDNRVIDFRNSVAFNIDTKEHKEIMEEAIKTAQENLKTLQDIDLTIMLSGSIALVSCFVIPIWYISLAATAVCAWYSSKRNTAHDNHQHSLKAPAEVWEWSQNCANANEFKDHDLIKNMRHVLFPLLSTEEVNWITNNKNEQEMDSAAQYEKKNLTIHGYHVNEKAVGLYQKMYGANQEGFTAFAKAVLASALVGFYRFGALAYNTVSDFTSTPSPKI